MKRNRPIHSKEDLDKDLKREVETCMNPWNGHCQNSDIAVYIYYNGRILPICSECWIEIAQKNIEWGYE